MAMDHSAVVFSVFGSSAGVMDIEHPDYSHNSAFFGVFSSATAACAAIYRQCRVLARDSNIRFYRFYAYRGQMGEDIDIDQDAVFALGGGEPEGLDAFYVEFERRFWW